LTFPDRSITLNLIILFQDDFIDNSRVRLEGRRLKHVLEVHRAAIEEELCVGLADGRIGTGKITSLGLSSLEMDVTLDRLPPFALPVTLILALPRPKVLRRVIRTIAAMGVKRLVLLNAFRVEKSYWSSPALRPDMLREQLINGLEQARDTIFPEVLIRPLFKPFVEDELPSISADSIALVAHPSADAVCPRAVNCPVTLAIGPEGGFISYEIEMFSAAGFTAFSCGERILHVESAVPALLARLF
jgi:16S rRNA (uracil1498-N3)-methyltransferase